MAAEWDFFISHASEDKATMARPLAEQLVRAGFRVWLDVFELKVGDSLRARIDEGLARSRFGIVILSPTFFAKRWTSAELGALFALDDTEGPRLIPIWHGVEHADVVKQSPLLADKLALRSRLGAFELARQIVDQLRDRLGGAHTIQRQLVSLLERGVVADVAAFLSHHPHQLAYAAGLTGRGRLDVTFRSDVQLLHRPWQPDIMLKAESLSPSDTSNLVVITLGPIVPRPGTEERAEDVAEEVVNLVRATDAYIERIGASDDDECRGIVAAGRRAKRIQRPRRSRTRVRSYDWLVDAFRHTVVAAAEMSVRLGHRGQSP